MKTSVRVIALVAVMLGVAAIIVYKRAPVQTVAPSTTSASADSKASVVLVANLQEADEKCACGDIIRAVRAAQKKGIQTQEFNPDSKSELLKRYRILTAPTVLFLDAHGKEIARYEGEDENTVEAIRSHLKRLTEGNGT